LRPDAPLRLVVRSGIFDTTEASDEPRRSFKATGTTQILKDFSSPQLPRITVTEAPDGAKEITFAFDGVGRGHAVDLGTAMLNRTHGPRAQEPWFGTMKLIDTPTETLILDVLTPHGWTDPTTLQTSTHGNLAIWESLPKRVPEFELPVKEKAVYLGTD